jgi:hypothetical protein
MFASQSVQDSGSYQSLQLLIELELELALTLMCPLAGSVRQLQPTTTASPAQEAACLRFLMTH